MPTHCMLDLETLGTKPGCVVAQIGAVAFDPITGRVPSKEDAPGEGIYGRPTFEVNVSIVDAQRQGLTIDASTVNFWFEQSEEARGHVFGGHLWTLRDAVMAFSVWYDRNKCKRVWGHGKEFDPMILGAAMWAVGHHPPWGFRDTLDTRTMFFAGNLKMPLNPNLHNALEDALHQAQWVCNAFQRVEEGTRHAPDESPCSFEAADHLDHCG